MAELHVLLAMPRMILRRALTLGLADDGVRVSDADLPTTACQLAKQDPADVAVVFLEANGRRGFGFQHCRELVEANPATSVLPVVDTATSALAREALDTGARGLFETSHGLTLLRKAVHVVAEGELWLSRRLVGSLLASPASGRAEPVAVEHCSLTAREREVLRLLALGQDHNAIADQLFVSPHTARTHIRNVMRKLGAHSRLEAVTRAQADGLLPGADA